ncbi:rod shape-determining protein MreC [Wenjunlia vitaminophila]|uniref:Cell shape-determining protein MreC n=1 Tax=Wenjunlia vitaminophila TaxID=76728 RepID=A0A0T6LKI8_WENVI|nr:rod shape-determining protein MreC [Wenjunlia vitaminophila]KRV46385.1 rod shape-determining protein MreC [Wenjunlia vitaminophila]
MRDTRESRLLLVLLVAIAFALITVDIRGGEESPLNGARSAAASVFGPAQEGVSSAIDPISDAITAVRDSGDRADRVAELERENAELKQRLSGDAADSRRAAELDRLLNTAGAGQYRVKAAQIIGIGAAQGLSWTVTIDVGSDDGIDRDMTVINGDGLVGRVSTVGRSTATVVLAIDPDFTVGTRLERTSELGFAKGQGDRPLRVQLLNGKAKVRPGDRLVTFGSQGGKPFVPGVPVGRIVEVERTTGNLTRTLLVEPFVSFTKLDLVGVVVEAPRKNPRDSVLPPKPKSATKAAKKKAPKKTPDTSGTGTARDGTDPNALDPDATGTEGTETGGTGAEGTDAATDGTEAEGTDPEADGYSPDGVPPDITPDGGRTGTTTAGTRRG